MSRKKWSTEKLFERALKNKTEKAIWLNIRELRIRPTLDVFEKCLELTKSKRHKEREIGISILAQLRHEKNPNRNSKNTYWFGNKTKPFYKQTVKLYFELLEKEKNIEVIESILWSIGHNHDNLSKQQIDKLCMYAETKNKKIKESLISALLTIDDPQAIKVLIKFSADKESSIRDWATFGIGSQIDRNNKDIRDALWSRIYDKHKSTKYEAIVGLARRKDQRVKEIIDRELLTENYGALLFEAILELGDLEHFEILKKQYKKEKNNSELNSIWREKFKECIDEIDSKTAPNSR